MIMKKLVSMTMAMAMMAALFVACGDDGTDDETPPALQIGRASCRERV